MYEYGPSGTSASRRCPKASAPATHFIHRIPARLSHLRRVELVVVLLGVLRPAGRRAPSRRRLLRRRLLRHRRQARPPPRSAARPRRTRPTVGADARRRAATAHRSALSTSSGCPRASTRAAKPRGRALPRLPLAVGRARLAADGLLARESPRSTRRLLGHRHRHRLPVAPPGALAVVAAATGGVLLGRGVEAP